MSQDADRRRVQRSALRVGMLVGAASAIVVAAGVVILVVIILSTARPDRPHGSVTSPQDVDHIVVDVDRVLPWVIVLGIVGVLVLGAVAWLAARWAVAPLSDALRLQREFVSDAGHELRTPLTALTSRIQILQRRLTRRQPVDATVVELRRDAAMLDDVLADMLLTAEGGSAEDGRADVADCLRTAQQTMEPLAEESGVALHWSSDDGITARMPAVTLTRLCVALIDNAIGHAPAGSTVTVRAISTGSTVEIRVADAGPGIAPEDAVRIFERFARAGESGRRRGFGLGLALVREAVTRYSGSVRIESTSPAGTVFLLTLPTA
ncbi:sensor histidine kinase [Microbacterium sp. SYP-A9085]|uniref:sensor histidine kinase n=1 Tax=Microbacterium sp. SYP-A9085 TaxID=2664454 RepID=UPI00129B5D94|nr:HAMP domain-containing sensor histidine kinase [Microbacterium sp. SYP-A9085]MRH27820.1 sensor histidine kinase [Microbacterium sp. SYP-A9085]